MSNYPEHTSEDVPPRTGGSYAAQSGETSRTQMNQQASPQPTSAPIQTPVAHETMAPPMGGYPGAQQGQPVESAVGTVRVDVVETPEDLVVIAELPGYDEDDVVLEGLNQQVRITAERDDEHADDQFHLRERPMRLERIIALPMSVEIEEATADFHDGVCRIEFPKAKQIQSHRIGFQ